MRRLILIVLALMLCSIGSAVPINPTIDWYTSYTAYRHYHTAYNPATGHLITNNRYYSPTELASGYVPELSIWSSADGSYIGSIPFADDTDPLSGGSASSPFSLTCTSDGVLYATDLYIREVVQMWADENTTGVLMSAPGVTSLCRGANVRGTSTSPTLYLANGDVDNDKGQVLQIDATMMTWTVVSTIPAPFCRTMISVKDRDTLLGGGPWMEDGDTSPVTGFPDVYRNMNPGSWAYADWMRDDTFNPEDATVGEWSYTIGGDYADGLYWCLLYWDAQIVAYDAVYGTILARMPVDTWGYIAWGKPSILYYGSLITEEGGAPDNTIFWGSRLYNTGYNGALGKMTYTPPQPVINELDYDQAGVDMSEFVEIWGLPGTDISSYTLSIVNGADGTETVIATIPPITMIPDDEFYVIGMSGVPNVDLVVIGTLQNGAPDAVVLRNASGTVIDAIGYEMGGPGGAASLPPWAYEGTGYKGGDNFGSKFSLGRKADGADTDDNQADFDVMWPTPGERNPQFTLWGDDMPYVDRFPSAGPELPWKSDFVTVRSINPSSVGAPDSPEAVTEYFLWGFLDSPSPDMVGRCDDPSGGGNVNMLGDHNFAQCNINMQAWVYTGTQLESIALFVRGIGDTGWRATKRSTASSSGYENCYAMEWCDDGTSTCLRAIKMLAADDSLTYFAADDTSYDTPSWHHLGIFANGTTVNTYVDGAVFSSNTDSDIATGGVGIGYREYGGSSLTGGLVDSIIIDKRFHSPSPAVPEVTDWDLY